MEDFLKKFKKGESIEFATHIFLWTLLGLTFALMIFPLIWMFSSWTMAKAITLPLSFLIGGITGVYSFFSMKKKDGKKVLTDDMKPVYAAILIVMISPALFFTFYKINQTNTAIAIAEAERQQSIERLRGMPDRSHCAGERLRYQRAANAALRGQPVSAHDDIVLSRECR